MSETATTTDKGLPDDWHSNDPVSEQAIQEALSLLPTALPGQYIQFLSEHNGGEGFIGDNYLILWRAEELVPFNREYEVDKYAPGLILIGSSGGGEAYAFDTRDFAMRIVRVPFIGMDLQHVQFVANNFDDIWSNLI